MFGLMALAVLSWHQIGKEEMPEFSMEWIRISIRYPGATAKDIELLVTKPVEEKIKGISGLSEVAATSSYGTSSFRISFEPKLSNLQEKVQEVKDAVNSATLPREADDPVFRQFRSSEKAIIDIGIYLKGVELLDTSSRMKLQEYALAFKNKILSQTEVSGISTTGYLRPELQIKVDPDKLSKFELSINQIKNQILQKNIRRSIGSLEDENESDVTVVSELENEKSLQNVIISSGFSGHKVKLHQVSRVGPGFEKNTAITKVQGHEGIIFNVQKNASIDIITAQKAVLKFVDTFKTSNQKAGIEFVIIDDESYDVRNRLSLIGKNGLIGFLLILIVLFIFLDLRSGIWVAMGIPFSLAFTLIMAIVMGYTVNNMTLAAIIIVLGIVVDDAIIVAENISRSSRPGDIPAATTATQEVVTPIIASILTTCAAFIPLYFFSGRFGLFVRYIPALIFLMLLASLIESFFILPSHMSNTHGFGRWFSRLRFNQKLDTARSAIVGKT